MLLIPKASPLIPDVWVLEFVWCLPLCGSWTPCEGPAVNRPSGFTQHWPFVTQRKAQQPRVNYSHCWSSWWLLGPTSAMVLTSLSGSLQLIDIYLCVVHGQRCSNGIQRVLRCWAGEPATPVMCLVSWLLEREYLIHLIHSLTSGITSAIKTQYRHPKECVTGKQWGPMLTIQCTANGQ